jgi:hypothetical protein
MAVGLGKNSPIILSLGKASYEALIQRHGQNVRWRISKKCTCITGSNHPDPRCTRCGGSGDVYDYQKSYTDTMRVRVDGGIAELPLENVNCEVLKAYDSAGIEYEPSQTGHFVKLYSPVRELNNGEVVEIVYRQSVTESIEEAELEYIGNGYYRVPGVLSDMSKIEGVDHRAPGDIVDIKAVFDSQGKKIDIVEYRLDTVRLKDNEAQRPLTAFGVKFVKPFMFFVLSQNFNEEDIKLLALHQGEALSTFPYRFDVSEGDIITVLSGTSTRKIVLKRKGDPLDDTLSDFFVRRVTYLATGRREYFEGTDFIIVGSNKIHWICEDPPEADVNMSITYQYLPTYRVHKFVPMLRTSENQKMPKKAVLKLFSALQESRGVNRNKAEGGS